MAVNRLKTYWLYWLKTANLSLQTLLSTRLASFMFILGKFVRFFMFLWFLFILKDQINRVSGYSLDQLITYFLIFNLFDLAGQLFFRGVYSFRNLIVSGDFDFRLVKPISPLFQALTGYTDFLDIPLFIVVLIFLIPRLLQASLVQLIGFFFLCLVSFLVITAIHIFVISIGVITTEVDHTVWIYRDLAAMARMPLDIYAAFIRALLTFVVPIALIFTVPAKTLFGLLSWQIIALSVFSAFVLYFLSLKFWHFALTKYSSASS